MARDPNITIEQQLRDREKELSALSVLVRSLARARILGDPLDEFFGAAEIWDTIVPVDPPLQTCQGACATTFIQASNACKVWPVGSQDRQSCLAAANAAFQQCVSYC